MTFLKKAFCLLLITLVFAECCGCGVKKVKVSAVTSGAAEQREADTFRISLSPEETLRMSNYMLSGRFIHEKKILYGSKHDYSGMPVVLVDPFEDVRNIKSAAVIVKFDGKGEIEAYQNSESSK